MTYSLWEPISSLLNLTSTQNCWLKSDTSVPLPDNNSQNLTAASTYASWISNLIQEYGIDGLCIDGEPVLPEWIILADEKFAPSCQVRQTLAWITLCILDHPTSTCKHPSGLHSVRVWVCSAWEKYSVMISGSFGTAVFPAWPCLINKWWTLFSITGPRNLFGVSVMMGQIQSSFKSLPYTQCNGYDSFIVVGSYSSWKLFEGTRMSFNGIACHWTLRASCAPPCLLSLHFCAILDTAR